jgi:hypothetical protein
VAVRGITVVPLPLHVTFRNMPPSEAVEAEVRRQAAKLDAFFAALYIVSWHDSCGPLERLSGSLASPGVSLEWAEIRTCRPFVQRFR